jgi:hypothetical protein
VRALALFKPHFMKRDDIGRPWHLV